MNGLIIDTDLLIGRTAAVASGTLSIFCGTAMIRLPWYRWYRAAASGQWRYRLVSDVPVKSFAGTLQRLTLARAYPLVKFQHPPFC
jgi:hypothetical protein